MRHVGELRHRLELAVEVRLRDDQARDVVPEPRGRLRRLGRATAVLGEVDRDGHDLDARPGAVGLQDAPVVGVDAGRHGNARAPGEAAGHERRLGGGGRAVVVRGARDLHAGQLTDQRLELVDALERALGHLRLVRRVRGRELRAPDHLADHGRDEVAVHAGAEEADLRDPVAAGQASQLRADLLLGERRRDVPRAGADRGRDVDEEILDRSDADRLEHPRSIGIGVWRIGHGQPAVRRSRQRSRPRPGGRRAGTDRTSRPSRSIRRRTGRSSSALACRAARR